jgi:hypothetical protein
MRLYAVGLSILNVPVPVLSAALYSVTAKESVPSILSPGGGGPPSV